MVTVRLVSRRAVQNSSERRTAENGTAVIGYADARVCRPEVVTDSRAMAANASASVREKRPDIPAIYFHGPPPMVQRLGEDMDIAYRWFGAHFLPSSVQRFGTAEGTGARGDASIKTRRSN
jgi:hypothetical protein